MSVEIAILPMEISEADFILEIRNHDATRFYVHNQRSFTKYEFVEWFQDNKPEWYIVSNDSVPFGYFRTSNRNEKSHSLSIGMDIHPDFRGKGLAKAAYAKFFNVLKAEGFENLSLEVLSHNFVARKLYQGLGFVDTGTKPYQHAVDSIKMELTI